MYSLQTSLKAKLKLSYFEHILRTQGSLKKGNNDGEKNRRQQEKKKIDYEVNWLHKRNHRQESAEAEQSRWAQDTLDVTHP